MAATSTPAGGVGRRFSPRTALLALLVVGTLVRLVLTVTAPGNAFDTESFRLVAARLGQGDLLHLYGDVNGGATFLRWPYPPGFLPLLAPLQPLAHREVFEALVRLPSVLADLGIALLVFRALERTGRAWTAVAAAGLVLLGPSFLANSGGHGQLDSLAILPVVAAVVVWERGGSSRALQAGLLIGLGACVKTVPAFFLLALLPTVRDRRELARLVGTAAALPVLALLPFFLADPHGVKDALTYRGLPGCGGLSLAAQPGLAAQWLGLHRLHETGLTRGLQDVGAPVALLALAVTAVLLVRKRVDPVTSACAVGLALLGYGVNFAPGYVIWVLPFLLLRGWLKPAAAVQVAMVAPLVLFYSVRRANGHPTALVDGVYVPIMLGLLAAALVAHAWLLRGGAARTGHRRSMT